MWCVRGAHRLLGASPGAVWRQRSFTRPPAGSDPRCGLQGADSGTETPIANPLHGAGDGAGSTQGAESGTEPLIGSPQYEVDERVDSGTEPPIVNSLHGAGDRGGSTQWAESGTEPPIGSPHYGVDSGTEPPIGSPHYGVDDRGGSSQGAESGTEPPIGSPQYGVDSGIEPPIGSDPPHNRSLWSGHAEDPKVSALRGRFWRRSLSPLDRVSHLLPPDFVSQEILDLRGAGGIQQGGTQGVQSILYSPAQPLATHGEDADLHPTLGTAQRQQPSPQGAPFTPGDLIVCEFRRRHYTEFKNMFRLTPLGRLNSNWGFISHSDIEGKLPGQRFRTSMGTEFLLKRPTLEEYVTMMKRGPTISYPKDAAAMLLMMDVNHGDTVLEAGSGSGGLSLFLSRAVGAAGRVYSFDVRADHHAIAKKNFQRWRNAWEHRGREPWPENVTFINKDIASALPDIKPVAFDSVALDMLNPQVALPNILPNLKQGTVCSVYLANITQVIDLLEGIRSCQLSLVYEKIVEVSWKDWLVAPSVRKDGSLSQRLKPQNNVESFQEGVSPDEDQESDSDGEIKPFGQVPYIARPLPWQTGHTAFLVQLRKFKPAQTRSEPEEQSRVEEE